MADDLSGQLASLKIDRSAPAPPPARPAWPLWLAIAALGGTAAWLGGQALNDGLRKPVVNLGEITTISPAQAPPPLRPRSMTEALDQEFRYRGQWAAAE